MRSFALLALFCLAAAAAQARLVEDVIQVRSRYA
jgi:hypothetical protein